MSQVVDNQASSRFELEEAGQVAFADYVRKGRVLRVPHVEAPPELRGTGAAGRLMEGMLAILRARGETIVPLCPYADAYIRRHTEWADLVAE